MGGFAGEVELSDDVTFLLAQVLPEGFGLLTEHAVLMKDVQNLGEGIYEFYRGKVY